MLVPSPLINFGRLISYIEWDAKNADIYHAYTPYTGITLVFIYTNLWLELDNCFSVAELVRALYRNRKAYN